MRWLMRWSHRFETTIITMWTYIKERSMGTCLFQLSTKTDSQTSHKVRNDNKTNEQPSEFWCNNQCHCKCIYSNRWEEKKTSDFVSHVFDKSGSFEGEKLHSTARPTFQIGSNSKNEVPPFAQGIWQNKVTIQPWYLILSFWVPWIFYGIHAKGFGFIYCILGLSN